MCDKHLDIMYIERVGERNSDREGERERERNSDIERDRDGRETVIESYR